MNNYSPQKILSILSDGVVRGYDFYLDICAANSALAANPGLESLLITKLTPPQTGLKWSHDSSYWGHAIPSFVSSELKIEILLSQSLANSFLTFAFNHSGFNTQDRIPQFVAYNLRPTFSIKTQLGTIMDLKFCTFDVPKVPDLDMSSSTPIKLSFTVCYEDAVIYNFSSFTTNTLEPSTAMNVQSYSATKWLTSKLAK